MKGISEADWVFHFGAGLSVFFAAEVVSSLPLTGLVVFPTSFDASAPAPVRPAAVELA